jgi:hypothetical protein
VRSSGPVLALWCLLLHAGCFVDIDLGGTSFRCAEEALCPAGQVCVDGVCRTPTVDAGGGGDDGATPGADAADDGRVVDGLQLLYRLGGGQAGQMIVSDESGASPPYDLTLADPGAVTWLEGAVRIDSPTIFSGADAATKVIDACVASNEITMEAFARADNLEQAAARIATLSLDTTLRNASLMQDTTVFAARLRTSEELNGTPNLSGGAVSTEALQHVVYVRHADGAEAIYVDGVGQVAGTRAGDHQAWDTTYRFALGNEFTLNRAWLGEVALVAVYCRALSQDEVLQNLSAGP